MIINRHNYEECFILYMDNELGSGERQQVEDFVQKNPDLKEELEIMMQFKLVPDMDIVYTGKEELMIPVAAGNSPVNLSNYEKWLVLYIDDELNIEQRKAVEQFISSHPLVKQELTLLQRSKLLPEPIIFDNKQSLYRKEENPDSYPVLFDWWKVAAAVVLILGLAFGLFMVLNKRTPAATPGLAKSPVPEQKINTGDPVVKIKEKNIPVTPTVITDNRKYDQPVKQTVSPIVLKIHPGKEQPVNKVLIQDKKQEEVVVENNNNNKPSNNLPRPLNNVNLITDPVKNDAVADNHPKEIINSPITVNKNNDVTTIPVGPSYIKSTTSDNMADLNQSEKKSKLRGFLRKVTRTFEKRTNMDATDDDKLLVGGLAFKLK